MSIISAIKKFKHITKLDPDKPNPDDLLKVVGESGTDLVIFGGTTGKVTPESLEDILSRSKDSIRKPKFVEPSDPTQIPPEYFEKWYSSKLFDYVNIPRVVNSRDSRFITGLHEEWCEMWQKLNKPTPQENVFYFGYIVLNPEASVALVSKADTDLTIDKIVAYSEQAALITGLVYLEGSGKLLPNEYIRSVRERLDFVGFKDVPIIYGGGITNEEEAKSKIEIGKADCICVGNIVYTDIGKYKDTIKGVKGHY